MKSEVFVGFFVALCVASFFNIWLIIPACLSLIVYVFTTQLTHTKHGKELQDATDKYEHAFTLCLEAYSNDATREEHIAQQAAQLAEVVKQVENLKMGNSLRFGK